jgi:LCP family protein required for cell wall assembly
MLSWVAIVASVLVFATSLGGYAYYRHLNGNISRIPGISALPGVQRPAAAPDKSENFLLVGSDTRVGLTPAELQEASTTTDGGSALSDTMILVHVPANAGKVTLVSFPRDSLVSIPAWTDPKSGKHYPARRDKLNSSFSTGAVPGGNAALTIATIEQLSGLHIDHYVQIDFVHFIKIVDALGGINVCLNTPAHDSYSGVNLPAGVSHVNGKQALAFVRQRHGLANGDLDRIRRQQYFIRAVLGQVTSSGTLLNPIRLTNFLEQATSAVTVDQGLSLDQLKNLAVRLRHLDPAHVTFQTLPISGRNPYYPGVGDVLLVDRAKADAMFAPFRAEQASPSSSPSQAPAVTVPPAQVRVLVLNGTSAAGLASRAATDLSQVGFVVSGKNNTSTATAGENVIRYGAGRAESAKTLQAAVPGATLQPDASLGSSLELVLGTDWPGARTVTVGGSAAVPSGVGRTAAAPSTPAQSTAGSAANNCAPGNSG